jgi:hypothetical protein
MENALHNRVKEAREGPADCAGRKLFLGFAVRVFDLPFGFAEKRG